MANIKISFSIRLPKQRNKKWRERERETDRQTDRDRDRQREMYESRTVTLKKKFQTNKTGYFNPRTEKSELGLSV